MQVSLARLWNIADDYEADILTGLLLKAGILWHCNCEPGGWDNEEHETACGRCGRTRSNS